MARLLGWVSILALGGVGFGAKPAAAAARVPTHVACVGDSITAGAGASVPAKNYPSVLQGLLGSQVQVQNFGHSGTTMLSDGFGDFPYEDDSEYQGATDFVQNAGANAVVDVVIMLGTNDSKPFNWTPTGKPKNDQQYLKDYRAMVEHFAALATKPLVFLALPLSTGQDPCCSIDGTVIHDEVIPLIKQLAIEKQLPIIDLNTPTANHPEYFVDGVHPNDAAYAIVAKIFHDGLLQDLASSSGGAGGSAGALGGASGTGAGGAAGVAGGSVSAGAGGKSGGAGGARGLAGGTSSGAGGAGRAGAAAGGAASKASAAPSSHGCAVVARPTGKGFLEPLLSTLIVATLIGLRRRPVLHARHRS